MCGIAGFVSKVMVSDDTELKAMTNVLSHRGPDACGYDLVNIGGYTVGLGHRRLSILDLSDAARQPMVFENYHVVFNGEIYNFNEIKSLLSDVGHSFKTSSDTEVILKSFYEWGIDFIYKLNGMFSIVLLDKVQGKVYFIRDRAGVKPLYIYQSESGLLFSSEIKSFHESKVFDKKLNMGALSLFLKYGYIPEPCSIFDDVKKVRAGSYMVYDLNTGLVNETLYWDATSFYKEDKLDIGESDAEHELEELLISSCEYRMISDVPVGVFLSGGYDSSLVAALIQKGRSEKINTFSIGFEEESYNEAEYAKAVSQHLGTNHTELYCTQKDALELIPKIPEIWDEPFADSSAIPTILVSQLARKSVTVSLSADGGDELFGGYNKYGRIAKKAKLIKSSPKFIRACAKFMLSNSAIRFLAEKVGVFDASSKMDRLYQYMDADENRMLDVSSWTFTETDISRMLADSPKSLETNFSTEVDRDWLSNILCTDYKTYLCDDILTKVDRATMSVSLEGREPLLDYRLFEFSAKLPDEFKIRNGTTKYLLKKIVHKYIPESLMDRPKMGFGVPISDWLKKDLKAYVDFYLNEERINRAGIFNSKEIEKLKRAFYSNAKVNGNKLWYLLIFEMWRERWCNQ